MSDTIGVIRRLTHPASEPVTRTEAKEHLRIESDFTADDSYIDALISMGRDHVERVTGHTWATAQFLWTVSDLKRVNMDTDLDRFNLPMAYVSSIDAITYLDDDDVSQTIEASDITLDQDRQRVTIPEDIDGHDWKITFTAGPLLGASEEEIIPQAISQAILLLVGDAYENRQASIVGTSIAENPAVRLLIWDYRDNVGL
jgi:uncharacterized phiE125 gp8 family phage protein